MAYSSTDEHAYGAHENMFFSYQDNVRMVYAMVDCAALIFGLSLNSLLVYLIRTKTVPAMRIYSKLLTMSCAMDLIVSFWTWILQPIPCVDHGYRTLLVNGFFRYSPQPIRYAVYLVWIQLMLFFLVTTVCQYVYRYCILCKDGEMSARIFWGLVTACFFLNAGHALVLGWGDYPRTNEREKMNEIASQVANESGITKVSFIAFVNAYDFRWIMHNLIMLTIIPGFYTVIAICFVKIRRAITQMNTFKLREYNNQVSAALLFQAILPTFEIVAWSMQIIVPMAVTRESAVWAVVFTDVPIHLVPVFNPLGTIMLVAPYRRAFLGYLGLLRNPAGLKVFRSATQILSRRTARTHPTGTATVGTASNVQR